MEVLSKTAALQLLAQLVGEERITQELAQAKELIQRLGYLPLALQLVGRYVKKRKISLSIMLQQLEEKGLEHGSLIVDKKEPSWTLNVKRRVEAALELSWEELHESAQHLGCLLSLFALAPIPWSLVESAAHKQDPKALKDARVELEKLHLLQGKDTYWLHQLIRDFFINKQKNLAGADEQKYNFCQAMVEVAQAIPEIPTLKEVTSLTLAIPHLAEVAQNLTDAISDENLYWAFEGLGRFYSGQGLYALAEPWRKQCVSVVRSRLGEEHLFVAFSYHNLAELYKSQGRYTEAEPLYMKALELWQRLLGEEHPDVASCYNNLALLYDSQGRYTEVEPLLMKALELMQRLLGEEHPDVAQCYNNLALLYDSQGRYTEAEPLYQQALKIAESSLGINHPHTITIHENLQSLHLSSERQG